MHLFLIGYRGSGKSTVGRLVAERKQLPFIDLDDWIEERALLSIGEIFERFGEQDFRRRETDALRQAISRDQAVIALGGGICESETNRDLLRASGKTVWLRAEAPTLAARIKGDPASLRRRPALTNSDPVGEVHQVLARRLSNYAACADYTLESGQLEPNSLAQKILDWWSDADNNS